MKKVKWVSWYRCIHFQFWMYQLREGSKTNLDTQTLIPFKLNRKTMGPWPVWLTLSPHPLRVGLKIPGLAPIADQKYARVVSGPISNSEKTLRIILVGASKKNRITTLTYWRNIRTYTNEVINWLVPSGYWINDLMFLNFICYFAFSVNWTQLPIFFKTC